MIKQFSLPYGDSMLQLSLEDSSLLGVMESRPFAEVREEKELVREVIQNPIGKRPLAELVQKGEETVVVVGDMTRLWVRNHVFLPVILDELNKGGIPDKEIIIVSATGDHRPQTDSEHRLLVGDEVFERVGAIMDHKAQEKEQMMYLGTTTRGTRVEINRVVAEAQNLVITGGIVYHFLAGWGGGKKAILPGVSGVETIMQNHSLAFLKKPQRGLNPDVRAGKLKGNPCSEDMVEGALMAKPTFCLNVIVDEDRHRIAAVVAGEMVSAHEEGCRLVEEHCQVPVKEKADLVVASCGGYPKDIDFYQTYKTIYNARRAVKKGGSMIIISESREGMGNPSFAAMFKDFSDNLSREASLREKYTIGGHMAYHTSVIAEECQLIILSSLPNDEVKKGSMIPVDSLDQALELVRVKYGRIPPAYIMPQGGTTFPQ